MDVKQVPVSTFDCEFDARTVLAGTAAQLAVAVPILVLVDDWTLVLATAIVAGGVASLVGDFYAQSANNGLFAALFGMLVLAPLFFVRHLGAFGGGAGDPLLYAAIFTAGELLALVPGAAIVGYVSAVLVAIVRRKRRAKTRV